MTDSRRGSGPACGGEPQQAFALNARGLRCKRVGAYARGQAYYERALRLLERAATPRRDDIATVYHNLGGIEHARGNYAAAEVFARKGLSIRRSLRPANPLAAAADLVALGAILDGQGRDAEAERLYREALPILVRGGVTLDVSVTLNNLGALYARRGRLDHAARLLGRAVSLKRRALGPRHPDVAVSLSNLAYTCRRNGKLARAAALYREAVDIFETAGTPDPRARICRAAAAATLPRQRLAGVASRR